jgi:hypothetical protein
MDADVRATDVVLNGARTGVEASLPRVRQYDQRTRLLLEGSIVGTLLRLAAPNVLVMFAQAAVGLIETYFIAKLGTDALAGVTLVFPVLMLMQMMSAGAMGGGISSAIAREGSRTVCSRRYGSINAPHERTPIQNLNSRSPAGARDPIHPDGRLRFVSARRPSI